MAPIPPNMRLLWDPYKVLDIYPNDGRFPCVGRAVTKFNTRCRWEIHPDMCQAACDLLDSMATIEPSKITEVSLASLAHECLCTERHQKLQYQIWEKVDHWKIKIREYSEERQKTVALKLEVKELRKELERARQQDPDQFKEEKAKSAHLKQKLESARQKLEEKNAQYDALELQRSALSDKVGALQPQLLDAFTAKDILRERLVAQEKILEEKGETCAAQIAELKQQFTDAEGARSELKAENTELRKDKQSLERQLRGIGTNFKNFKVSKDKEIDGLETLIEDLRERSHQGNELRNQLEETKTTTSTRIKELEERLENSKECLEEHQRTSSQEADSLRRQLEDSSKRLEALKAASSKDKERLQRELQGMSQQLVESKAESSAQMSDVRHTSQKLRMQKHFSAFCSQVHMLVKQKKYEQVVKANATLTEQAERLMRQIGAVDKQLADQNQALSFLKLQDARRGICAVVATQPRAFSVKRISKLANIQEQSDP